MLIAAVIGHVTLFSEHSTDRISSIHNLSLRSVLRSGSGSVSASYVSKYCVDEADRQEWTVVASKLRNAAKNAYISGADVEQLLAEKDETDTTYISINKFKTFLGELAQYGNLTAKDVNICCRHFSKRETDSDVQRGVSPDKDPVSLRTVMSFLGKEYGGSLTSRVKRLLQPDPHGENLLKLLRKHSRDSESVYPIEDILRALDEKGVFAEVSREQMRALFHKLEPNSKNVSLVVGQN